MTRSILAAVAVLCCGEMVDSGKAVDAMEAAGYKDVRVTAQRGIAPEFYGCDKHDAVAFDVTATNPAGKPSKAVVCCGLVLKGCTIRH